MLRDWMRFGLAALALGASPAVAQEPFYKGKTINIMVGFGPGGGYDLYARLLARVLGNHIPGVPNVVVQNMTGAGGVRAANHVFTAAPKDGLTVAGAEIADAEKITHRRPRRDKPLSRADRARLLPAVLPPASRH